ncbi:MAG: DUF7286 family protein, partial [Haloferacaceae archaeon]
MGVKRGGGEQAGRRQGRTTPRNLSKDTRGRVPFAILGVVLVLTSVAFVGHTLTQPAVNPNVDASHAVSQTDSVTQSAIRTGAQRGIEAAAAQPLTSASETDWGRVFDTGETFRTYLRATIYLEVADSLEDAGQEIGEVRTNVSVPDVDEPAALRAAIDRVSLEEPKEGVLTVTISNVSTVARTDDRVIEERETAMTVSIATPIMQLHDRVDRFERALEAGVTEPGFTQRFSARLYALGWARGYAQNYKAPITQVIGNRHVEPAANDAIYRTQRDIFGGADPELQDANRLGWTCMALKDGGAMFDEYMASNDVSYRNTTYTGDELVFERSNGSRLSADVPVDGASTGEALCSGAELALGDQVTGELPSAPGSRDLLGEAPGMNATDTIGVNETADAALARLASPDGEYAIEDVIDRIYTIEGEATSRSTVRDPLELSGNATCNGSAASNGTYTLTDWVSVNGTSVTPVGGAETYYEARSVVEVGVSKYRRCPTDQDNSLIDTDTMAVVVTTTFGERDAS